MLVVGIIVGLIVLMFLVAIHELGHAVVAKRNGVEVKEYAIGFPPKIKKWQPKDSFLGKKVTYSLNWLPLGGFVRLKGEYDSAKGKGSYGSASFWVKTKILLAGVLVNWVAAAVLFSILALFGLPKILPQQVVLPIDNNLVRSPLVVARVNDDSPAQKAGLQAGDQIISVDGVIMKTSEQLVNTTKTLASQEVEIELSRGGELHKVAAIINDEEQAKTTGYLGVAPSQTEKIYATWSAPILGLATTGQLTFETLKGVGNIIVKGIGGFFGQFFGSDEQKQTARTDLAEVGGSVAGPVGILGVLFPAVVESGFGSVILMAAIISLTLAVMNILPIPALDGGRWTVMTVFRLLKKPLTREREEKIQATGFLLLLLLTIMVTWNDITKFF